jgi:hypothetical protein
MNYFLLLLNFINLFCFSNLEDQTYQKAPETYDVEWINVVQNIPIGADLYDYAYLPEAILFINGSRVSDANVYYEYGVNHTTLHVVSTTHINTYHIYYKAVFSDYGYSSTREITLNIIDNLPPTLLSVEAISIPLGTTLSTINYNAFINYVDNYNEFKDIKLIVIGSGNIKNNTVGVYPITYHIVDTSGNYLDVASSVTVYDNISPTIRQTKELIINIKSSVNLSNYFEIKDNYDTVLNVTINDSMVDYNLIGYYTISVYASDSSGNSTYEVFGLQVKDIEAPTFILISQEPKLNVYEESQLSNLERFILFLSDNYNEVSQLTIEITHNIDISTLGKYEVYYRISDVSGNTTSKILKLSVADLLPPECTLIAPLTLEVFSEEPVWFFYFQFSDNYNKSSDLDVSFSEKVDMKKLGAYQLVVTVTDSSKNKTSFIYLVSIIDSIAPEVRQKSELIVFDFLKKDFTYYFEITDNYYKDFIITIDDAAVNYEKVGEYPYHFIVSDKSNNKIDYLTYVYVIDNELPTIVLKHDTLYLSVFDDVVYLNDNIRSISDNYSAEVLNLEITTNFEAHIIGAYEAIYKVTDQSGNYVTKVLNIYVQDYTVPVFSGEDYLVIKGSKVINILSGIKAIDAWDGDLTSMIIASPATISTTKLGRHIINYYVCDNQGNSATFTRVIEVKDSFHFNLLNTLPFILIFASTTGLIVFFLKRNKVKK